MCFFKLDTKFCIMRLVKWILFHVYDMLNSNPEIRNKIWQQPLSVKSMVFLDQKEKYFAHSIFQFLCS